MLTSGKIKPQPQSLAIKNIFYRKILENFVYFLLIKPIGLSTYRV